MDVMESRGYTDVYDLLNCPIPDYPNCPEIAQSCVRNNYHSNSINKIE